jgi:excisionase family DNA binding protein
MATKSKPRPTSKPTAANTEGAAVAFGDIPSPTPPMPVSATAVPEVMTLSEAATFLRVPTETLRTDAVGGRIPGRLVGDEWRFARSALIAWLSQPETRKKSMLSVIGAFKDDETLEPMVEEIYRERKRNTVGG